MLTVDRRLRPNDRPTLYIFAAWILVSAILITTGLPQILAGEYHGPDDALRMVQVRDLLAGQPWYDLHQYRMTPPDGTLMHWSRLVDLPIAALVLFFSLFLEAPTAERAAMIATPLLALLLTMLALGRLAWRMFDRNMAVLTCLVLMLLPLIIMQYKPLRVDHHSWQILTVAVAVWGLSWRKAAQGGTIAGLAMAFGLMISLEVIFIAAAFGIVLALRWLRDQSSRWWLVSYLQMLALGLVVLFVATRGLPDLATHCDVISPPQIGLFLIVALGTGALAVPAAIPRVPLISGLALSGLIGIAFVGWSAPQCLAPPFAGLDPLVREFWYANVAEGRPFWRAPLISSVAAVVQPLIALAIAIHLAMRSRDWTRVWWFEYAGLLAIAYLAGLLTFRSIAFASVLSAIPIAWFVMRVFERWRSHQTLLPKIKLAFVLYVVIFPAFPVVIYERSIAPEPAEPIITVQGTSCELRQSIGLLNELPAGRVFAPLDIGPVMLYKSHHSVVASSHHRAEQAMRDVIFSYISDAATAKRYIDQYEADYVVVCADLLETKNYSNRGGPEGLMSRLISGDVPEWLEEVELGGPEELKAWRVVRD